RSPAVGLPLPWIRWPRFPPRPPAHASPDFSGDHRLPPSLTFTTRVEENGGAQHSAVNESHTFGRQLFRARARRRRPTRPLPSRMSDVGSGTAATPAQLPPGLTTQTSSRPLNPRSCRARNSSRVVAADATRPGTV